jgi:hypothetical protein
MRGTRELLSDARSGASNHPYLVVGLGMTLIALLTIGAMLMLARRRGMSPSELADFRRWRRRADPEGVDAGGDDHHDEILAEA